MLMIMMEVEASILSNAGGKEGTGSDDDDYMTIEFKKYKVF